MRFEELLFVAGVEETEFRVHRAADHAAAASVARLEAASVDGESGSLRGRFLAVFLGHFHEKTSG